MSPKGIPTATAAILSPKPSKQLRARRTSLTVLLIAAFAMPPASIASHYSGDTKRMATPYHGTLPSDRTLKNESSLSTNEKSAEKSEQIIGDEKGDDAAERISSGWAIPIDGPLSLLTRTTTKVVQRRRVAAQPQVQQEQPKELTGSISTADPYQHVGCQMDRLLETALERDEKTKAIDMAVSHYRKKSQIVIAETKDAFDYMIPYRGFGPSAEAGDIILGEKLKMKSRASAEFARQKNVDETHLKVTTCMFQVAMGIGMSDRERGDEIVDAGMKSLKDLVGEEEAEKTAKMLANFKDNFEVPQSMYEQKIWDVAQKQAKQNQIFQASIEEDPVVKEIKKRVHKYNRKSRLSMVTSQVLQTGLGVAALTPSFIGPGAKVALLTYVMATGGPESCKLLKELYLDKRFESRCKVISEEAHMAIDNYQMALMTRNPVLLACSESLLGQMIGEMGVKEIMGTALLSEKKHVPGA
ncbi:MAG TPA: hypothetical protein EYM95_01405 [Candidatus Obscuribacterales bacterium]|nr:hypothetical protein [Candidatus Obscuribacterales bacterium]